MMTELWFWWICFQNFPAPWHLSLTSAGPDRVEELRGFFADLKAAGAKLTIITKGNVGACRFLLQEEGLLGFFEKVFGMLGQFYGESDFDQANKQPSELEGTADCQLPDAKAKLIQALMSQEGLSTGEAVLVEDDPAEIASVKGICQSVFVSERKGMTTAELEELRSMVGARKDSSQVPQAKTVATPKQVPAAATSKMQAAVPPPPPTGFSGICHAAAKGKVAPPPPPEGFSGVCKTAATPKIAKAAENIAVEPKVPVAKAVKPDALVKHVYFDFDQTISKVHVFKQLAGWEPGVAGQHALSERGQIHRLKLLNDSSQYQYQPNGHVMPCPAGAKGASSWTAGALGGPWCKVDWTCLLLCSFMCIYTASICILCCALTIWCLKLPPIRAKDIVSIGWPGTFLCNSFSIF